MIMCIPLLVGGGFMVAKISPAVRVNWPKHLGIKSKINFMMFVNLKSMAPESDNGAVNEICSLVNLFSLIGSSLFLFDVLGELWSVGVKFAVICQKWEFWFLFRVIQIYFVLCMI